MGHDLNNLKTSYQNSPYKAIKKVYLITRLMKSIGGEFSKSAEIVSMRQQSIQNETGPYVYCFHTTTIDPK